MPTSSYQAVTIALLSLALSACVGNAGPGDPATDAGQKRDDAGGGAGGVDAAAAAQHDAAPPPAFPNETVTGWTPPGGHTTLVGSQTITANGTLLEDVEIGGCLTISATNVTVRRALIRCQGTGLTVSAGASAVIEDVTIDGEGAGAKGVHFRGTGSMSRLDVHGYKNGIDIGSTENVSLTDSYVHDSVPCGVSDNDQTFYQLRVGFSDGITVTHNNLDRGGADTCQGVSNSQRAHTAYLVQMSTVSTFQNNLVNGGNGACVWIQNNCKDLAVHGNHFGSDPYATCGQYGPAYSTSGLEEGDVGNDGCTWTDNVWDETGDPVPTP